jgi:hypothetical protein
LLVPTALVVIATLTSPGSARAAGKGVSFEHRDYNASIQPSGDVAVSERWVVQFTGGPFTTAHLDLYLAQTSGIDFGTVDGATPGSQQVRDITDDSGAAMREITWEYPAVQDTSKGFTIPYTIHGALGLNDSQAWLDWHFLDGNGRSDYAVASSTITETLPSAAPGAIQVSATYPGQQPQTTTPTDHSATITAQGLNSGQSLEALIVFPRSELDASVQRPSWQQGDAPPTLPTFPGTGTGSGSTGGQAPGSGTAPFPFGAGVSSLCGALACPGIVLVFVVIFIFGLLRRAIGLRSPARGFGWGRPYGMYGPYGWGGPWGWGGPYGGYGPSHGTGTGPGWPIFGDGGSSSNSGGMGGGGGSSGFGGGGGGGGGSGGGGSSGFG